MNFFKKPKKTIQATRLTFKRDVIESLKPTDYFKIYVTNDSETFLMTKKDFYDTFPNVITSVSYNDIGFYNYKKTPQKAYKFLVR